MTLFKYIPTDTSILFTEEFATGLTITLAIFSAGYVLYNNCMDGIERRRTLHDYEEAHNSSHRLSA